MRRGDWRGFAIALSSGSQIPNAFILPWRTVHGSLECGAEGALGFVPKQSSNSGDRVARIGQPVAGQLHPPLGQIFHG